MASGLRNVLSVEASLPRASTTLLSRSSPRCDTFRYCSDDACQAKFLGETSEEEGSFRGMTGPASNPWKENEMPKHLDELGEENA
jgi:hypothetical protein